MRVRVSMHAHMSWCCLSTCTCVVDQCRRLHTMPCRCCAGEDSEELIKLRALNVCRGPARVLYLCGPRLIASFVCAWQCARIHCREGGARRGRGLGGAGGVRRGGGAARGMKVDYRFLSGVEMAYAFI